MLVLQAQQPFLIARLDPRGRADPRRTAPDAPLLGLWSTLETIGRRSATAIGIVETAAA